MGFPCFWRENPRVHHGVVRTGIEVGNSINGFWILVRQNLNWNLGARLGVNLVCLERLMDGLIFWRIRFRKFGTGCRICILKDERSVIINTALFRKDGFNICIRWDFIRNHFELMNKFGWLGLLVGASFGIVPLFAADKALLGLVPRTFRLQFREAQQHYHTVYKEILAVKYGIQKFDFYLQTKNFIVEMDNSSFPKILEFRNKIPPNPQLLRLKDWFARYDFTVRHVKGQHNIIADMLSRPPPVHFITSFGSVPLIYMATSTSSSSSSSQPLPVPNDMSFPPELLALLPSGQQPSLARIQEFAQSHLRVYLSQIQNQGVRHSFQNPTRPFLDPFLMPPFYYFSPQVLWFLWCLSTLHHHAIVFPLQALYVHLHDPSQQHSLLWTFLQWFDPLSHWKQELTKLIGNYNLWKLSNSSAA